MLFDPKNWPDEDNPAKRAAESVFVSFCGTRPSESQRLGDVFGDRLGEVEQAMQAMFGPSVTLSPQATFGQVYAPLFAANY